MCTCVQMCANVRLLSLHMYMYIFPLMCSVRCGAARPGHETRGIPQPNGQPYGWATRDAEKAFLPSPNTTVSIQHLSIVDVIKSNRNKIFRRVLYIQ